MKKTVTNLYLLAAVTALLFSSGCRNSVNQNQSATSVSAPTEAPTNGNDWTLVDFVKQDTNNPILTPGKNSFTDPILNKKVFWEEKDVFNPATVVRNGKLYLLYRAEDKIGKFAGTSRIGLAESTDGVNFTRHPEPVLYPDNDTNKKYEWEGGIEDPRVVEDGAGKYIMTYSAYDGDKARLFVATSTDLMKWVKHGPAFAKAYNGKYVDQWTKSGAVVSEYHDDGRIIATKVNGKYWMYWGDKFLWLATSDDLVNWQPVEMEAGEKPPVPLKGEGLNMPDLKIALPTRDGKFDSDLVEPGPPAMLINEGILVIYNSRNIPAIGDKSLPEGTYTASQALFDKNNPAKLIKRMDNYFIKPDKPYETTGQVNQVCFVEGLAKYKGSWFLYYGTADSKIAVAKRKVTGN